MKNALRSDITDDAGKDEKRKGAMFDARSSCVSRTEPGLLYPRTIVTSAKMLVVISVGSDEWPEHIYSYFSLFSHDHEKKNLGVFLPLLASHPVVVSRSLIKPVNICAQQ